MSSEFLSQFTKPDDQPIGFLQFLSAECRLERLHKQNVPIYGLTNWSSETYYAVEPNYPFLKWFKGIIVSGDEGIIKPDPEIYELALSRFNLERQETLFIDDKSINAEGASRAGMQSHVFRSADELEKLLIHEGLLQLR
ncbi:MAG: HAD-IA family hydrolase [Deltaproteobacteria bacterium]|nr:HAD-IA family hydrolase [Deltaproteobacteria bacterium]